MLCQSCQHTNPDDNRFCGKCGALLSAEPDGPSQAQSTVDYLQRVAREHPRGERPENPATPEGTYETQPATEGMDLEQERERSRNVYQFRDSHPAPLDFRSKGYSREGYDDAEQPVVQMQPELIEFDNQIPLIAEPGMDRRKPEWRFREKPILQPTVQAEVHEQARQYREANGAPVNREPEVPIARETAPVTPHYTDSIFGLNTSIDDTSEVEDAAASSLAEEEIRFEPPVRREVNSRNNFLDFSEPTHDDRTSLHGPSFLGLGSMVEYADEDEGGSHVRRNLALAILLVLVVLGALQWRSIRDLGMRYAGSMHLPGRGAQAAPAPVPAQENSQAPQATEPASNGKPEMVAEATQNPNAKQQSAEAPTGAQSADGATANAAGAGNQANASTADNGGNGGGNSSAQPSSGQPNTVASNREGSRLPQGEPANADDGSTDGADNEEASTPARKNKAEPKDAARPDPAQAELAQASAAASPETAAALLWRAVGKGSAEAQVRLADMYADGRGVPQNCEQAVILLNSAANKNFARARIRLGSMYATGKCVKQDRVAAYQWMSRALDSSPGSQWVEENRQMLWTQMSEDEKRRASGKM